MTEPSPAQRRRCPVPTAGRVEGPCAAVAVVKGKPPVTSVKPAEQLNADRAFWDSLAGVLGRVMSVATSAVGKGTQNALIVLEKEKRAGGRAGRAVARVRKSVRHASGR